MAYSNRNKAPLTENAEVVLRNRYYLKNEDGEVIEDFDGLCRRVALHVGQHERQEIVDDFYWMLRSLDFLPNTPTLVNAGTGRGTLSACFVLPVEDTMEGITKASHDQAMVQKFGGGTGFSVSDIRPKGYPVSTTHGVAMGPVGVLEYLSATSKMVTEGGIRDGANMCVLNVHHPDIMEFIKCKTEEGKIHNFNISVGITDEFMEALEDGENTGDYSYPLYFYDNPSDPECSDLEVVDYADADEVWRAIIDGAWRNGEPGCVFLDEINRDHPAADDAGIITATNPCGEQPLLPNESCNLGSINVANFIKKDDVFGSYFDWDRLRDTIHTAVKFLDNTIDVNQYATEEIKEANLYTRKIGLGVMGWADALTKLRMAYDSEEAVDLAGTLMKFVSDEAYKMSVFLGEKRGPTQALDPQFHERRNVCCTTIAPTGSISMIAGCSSGIEPLFSLAWRKQNILGDKSLDYVNEELKKWVSDEVIENLIAGESIHDQDVDDWIKVVFTTSSEIAALDHVKMQAAFQRHVDSGVSKTINLPNNATIDDVERAYWEAYRSKCKGITVYRAGSREKEVLVSNEQVNPHRDYRDDGTTHYPDCADECEGDLNYSVGSETDNEDIFHGRTIRYKTGRGKVYITINRRGSNGIQEVFINHGKAGGNDAAMAEALSRLISISLQDGVKPERIIKQLQGITDTPVWDNGVKILSLPDAVAKAMAQVEGYEDVVPVVYTDRATGKEYFARGGPSLDSYGWERCPECEWQGLINEDGCAKCMICGYSEC